MVKCSACGKFIASNKVACCSVCPSVYHKECVALSEIPASKDWACPDCKKKVPKYDNTPVRGVQDTGTVSGPRRGASSTITAPPAPVATAVAPAPPATLGIGMQELRHELTVWVTEMREFRQEMSEFRSAVAGIHARIDGVEQRLEVAERRLELVEQLRTTAGSASEEMAELECTVSQLKLELNDRDQEALLSDLEIGHLPEDNCENVLHAVTVMAAKFGVALEERDIVFAERLGAAAVGEAPRARRIVVRLARRGLRDELLVAARVRRNLSSSPEQGGRIFLNERLTRANRQLFHSVREECRRLQWRYSWTKRGRIYARQSDGEQAYLIRSEADVKRIFGLGSV